VSDYFVPDCNILTYFLKWLLIAYRKILRTFQVEIQYHFIYLACKGVKTILWKDDFAV
jgi:hypothetical protein